MTEGMMCWPQDSANKFAVFSVVVVGFRRGEDSVGSCSSFDVGYPRSIARKHSSFRNQNSQETNAEAQDTETTHIHSKHHEAQ